MKFGGYVSIAEKGKDNFMKKIVVVLVISLSMMLAMVGCSKNKDDKGDSSDASPTPVENNDDEATDNEDDEDNDNIELPEEIENPVVKEEYDFNDYIKLGKYKGIEVKVEQLEVTDEDIDLAIQIDMFQNGGTLTDVTGRTAELGDTLDIDFVGYHKGEEFEGGSAEGHELLLGSKSFIDGFEEQLVGAAINDEIEVNVVFPENYMNTTLAGEGAMFKVTVNGIKNYEINEDFVKDTLGFDTVDAYRESVRNVLVEESELLMQSKKENDIFNAVIDGSEITLPENLVEYHGADLRTLYTNISAQYGLDLETFIVYSGYTMEAFENDIKKYADNMATRELIIKAISAAENIEATEEEIEDEVERYALSYGFESKEEFIESKTINIDMIIDDILFYKIMDFLVEESVEI